MGLTVTSKGVINSGANANNYAFGAFTPSGNSPILVLGAKINGANPAALVTDDQSNVWNIQVSIGSSTAHTSLWTTQSPVAASTIITVSFTGATGINAEVFEIPFGTLAQVNTAAGVSSATPAVAMGGAFNTSSAGVAFLFSLVNPPAVTEPSGWTESSDTGHTLPTEGIETAFINGGETGTTITWGSNSAEAWRAIVVEILDNSPVGAAIRYFRRLLGVGY